MKHSQSVAAAAAAMLRLCLPTTLSVTFGAGRGVGSVDEKK